MPETLFVLAHGAGAPSSSAWMRAWAERLRGLGAVEAFDYPYMAAGRRSPDPLPRLIEAHAQALAAARAAHPACPRVILAGKSMGSRVGCHLSLEAQVAGPVAGLVCLGYPLCGMGKRSALRDQVLRDLATPVLFVQGTRDKLCPLDLLEEVRRGMRAPSEVHVVEGGDHSLALTAASQKRTGVDQDTSDRACLDAIARFVGALAVRA